MPKGDRLTTAEAARLAEVKPATWRGYVRGGTAPQADGHLDGRTPYWLRGTVETWLRQRPGRGARTDLQRERPGSGGKPRPARPPR